VAFGNDVSSGDADATNAAGTAVAEAFKSLKKTI
jgi:hypothetical protein